QINNLKKSLRYIFINLRLAKIYVFINGLFANNKNLSLQIGFVLAISTETKRNTEFTLSGNIIYTSFIKCKRVTRVILASELYIIIAGIDMLIALGSTINIITNKLGLARLPTIIYTNSLSFYKCIVKLGTIKEKRLIINIITIR
ncbi:hypothetical protein DL98DRAFT_420532, partial [Cadophora sp. DSE1049]